MSGKVKVRLTHTCNMPAHPGAPGDVIAVDEDLANSWVYNGGCVLVEDDVPLTSEKKQPKAVKPAAKTDEK